MPDWGDSEEVMRFIRMHLLRYFRSDIHALSDALAMYVPDIRDAYGDRVAPREKVDSLVNMFLSRRSLNDLLDALDQIDNHPKLRRFTNACRQTFSWATDIDRRRLPIAQLKDFIAKKLNDRFFRGAERVFSYIAIEDQDDSFSIIACAGCCIAETMIENYEESERVLEIVSPDEAVEYGSASQPFILHVRLSHEEPDFMVEAWALYPADPFQWKKPLDVEEQADVSLPRGGLLRIIDSIRPQNSLLSNVILCLHVETGYVLGKFHEWQGGPSYGSLDQEMGAVVIWPLPDEGASDTFRGCPRNRPLRLSDLRLLESDDARLFQHRGARVFVVSARCWQNNEGFVQQHHEELCTILHAGSASPQVVYDALLDGNRTAPPYEALTRVINLRKIESQSHDMHIIWTDRQTLPTKTPFRNAS